MTVYFITTKGRDDQPVKIGMTSDLDRRLSGLQTSHHEGLEIVAAIAGGRETEQYLHESLADSHIRGEWFERTPEVNAAIARARRIGASSLPIFDAGSAKRSFDQSTDADEARVLVRQLLSAIASDQTLSVALSMLCRRLNRSCPSMTARRLRSLYNGEPRRVDAFEMRALADFAAEISGRDEAKDSLIIVPVIADYLDEVGAPLSPEQTAIVDRYLQRCSDALAAGVAE